MRAERSGNNSPKIRVFGARSNPVLRVLDE
jgi:hypothetical protein